MRMNVKRPPRNWHIWYVTWYTLGTTVTVHLQAGNILHDWCTTIGTGALNVVKSYFLHLANQFQKDCITKYVKWVLDPKRFNFIYGAPNGEVV